MVGGGARVEGDEPRAEPLRPLLNPCPRACARSAPAIRNQQRFKTELAQSCRFDKGGGKKGWLSLTRAEVLFWLSSRRWRVLFWLRFEKGYCFGRGREGRYCFG